MDYLRSCFEGLSMSGKGRQATVRVRDHPEPILTVRLTYYLDGGRVGVYCGSQTSAKFRRMRVDLLAPQAISDPPPLAPRQ